jgi:hydrogenase nickel incorporation protein HypA/HybF
VLPEAMQFAFECCARGTWMEGARLEIDEIGARGQCHACGRETELDAVVASCAACGGVDVEVIAGGELRIREVEVE